MAQQNDSPNLRAENRLQPEIVLRCLLEPLRGPAWPARRSIAVGIWSFLLFVDLVLVLRVGWGGGLPLIPPSIAVFSTVLVAIASCVAWFVFRFDHRPEPVGYWRARLPILVSILGPAVWCLMLVSSVSPLTLGMLFGVILFQWLTVLYLEMENAHCRAVLQTWTRDVSNPVIRNHEHSSTSSTSVASRSQTPSSITESVSRDPIKPGHDGVQEWLASTTDRDYDCRSFSDAVAEVANTGDSKGHDEAMTQWMSRRNTDEGEVVEGWARVEFSAGQRDATVHLSFCPPLGGRPDIQTEDLDGSDLEIRIPAVFPFGARLSVRRLGSTTEVQRGRIGVVAAACYVKPLGPVIRLPAP